MITTTRIFLILDEVLQFPGTVSVEAPEKEQTTAEASLFFPYDRMSRDGAALETSLAEHHR